MAGTETEALRIELARELISGAASSALVCEAFIINISEFSFLSYFVPGGMKNFSLWKAQTEYKFSLQILPLFDTWFQILKSSPAMYLQIAMGKSVLDFHSTTLLKNKNKKKKEKVKVVEKRA